MTHPLLQITDLCKYFPIYSGLLRRVSAHLKAVNGVSFSIEKGRVLGLVGESGSGKSTIGRCLLGLETPTSGTITFNGTTLSSLQKNSLQNFKQQVQIVFQDPLASLNPRKTILEAIGRPLILHGMAKTLSEAKDIVAATLTTVGLSGDAMHRYPHQFSGGQQQRICIGRAIALKPKLIVLDEALSALDVSIQAQVSNLLQELKATMGLSYLFISHDLSLVRHLCDDVAVLYLGNLMEFGPANELFSTPKHPYTQALLSAIPARHPAQAGKRMQLQGEIPSPVNPPSGCPFRTRCPYAREVCCKTPPTRFGKDPRHFYRCIL